MSLTYKIFLVVFIIFMAFSIFQIDWNLGIWHEDNAKFILSFAAGAAGIFLVIVLNTWSKLAVKRK